MFICCLAAAGCELTPATSAIESDAGATDSVARDGVEPTDAGPTRRPEAEDAAPRRPTSSDAVEVTRAQPWETPNGWALSYEALHGLRPATGLGIAVDSSDNAYVVGQYYDAYGFPDEPLPDVRGGGSFVASWDARGDFQWASPLVGASCGDIEADDEGNVYLACRNDGVLSLPGVAPYDGYVASYDRDGRRRWIVRFGGAFDRVAHVALSGGLLYVAGALTASFVDGDGATHDVEPEGPDAYVASLTLDGRLRWSLPIRGGAVETVDDLVPTADGVLVAGGFDRALRIGEVQATNSSERPRAFYAARVDEDGLVRSLYTDPSARAVPHAQVGVPDVGGVIVAASGLDGPAVLGMLDDNPGFTIDATSASFADVTWTRAGVAVVTANARDGAKLGESSLSTTDDVVMWGVGLDGAVAWGTSFASRSRAQARAVAVDPDGHAVWVTGSVTHEHRGGLFVMRTALPAR